MFMPRQIFPLETILSSFIACYPYFACHLWLSKWLSKLSWKQQILCVGLFTIIFIPVDSAVVLILGRRLKNPFKVEQTVDTSSVPLFLSVNSLLSSCYNTNASHAYGTSILFQIASFWLPRRNLLFRLHEAQKWNNSTNGLFGFRWNLVACLSSAYLIYPCRWQSCYA